MKWLKSLVLVAIVIASLSAGAKHDRHKDADKSVA
jgi:hypothetical protein